MCFPKLNFRTTQGMQLTPNLYLCVKTRPASRTTFAIVTSKGPPQRHCFTHKQSWDQQATMAMHKQTHLSPF